MPNPSFIERQFPVGRISKECFKERKAGSGQTLTGVGKWWGRKPLFLVRSTLLGCLMPCSQDPKKDLDIFQKILTMDDEGLWKRKNKAIPGKRLQQILGSKWDDYQNASKTEKKLLEKKAFRSLGYDEKITYCSRPEQISGPSEEAWNEINAHLQTNAASLSELIEQLGEKLWERRPRVGDVFCGGGSIPFEASRVGADAFASDLNPVATLLTWGAVNLLGAAEEEKIIIEQSLHKVYEAVDQKVCHLGIEHSALGERADAYLYCVEAHCPATGYFLPLAPSWVISEKDRVCAVLKKDEKNKRYAIEIVENPDDAIWEKAQQGTVADGYMICPESEEKFSIRELRGDNTVDGKSSYGLRTWENDDIMPQEGDLFQERLYCIRWKPQENGKRTYRAPTSHDLKNEESILSLVEKNLDKWQQNGWIPSTIFDPEGDKTSEPVRTRGWTHWHHLFTPRQLLYKAWLMEEVDKLKHQKARVAGLLGVGCCANWNSRLSHWNNENIKQVFYNQALNTFFNFASRGFHLLQTQFNFNFCNLQGTKHPSLKIAPMDARDLANTCDIWITDPPYADAVHFHELADFFLAWYEKQIPEIFPEWYTDAKQALAVRGPDGDFKHAMVEIYENLCNHMPKNGLQVVMFTHQDAGVWADLGMILARAGLRVSNAWTIATETANVGIKQGNYVQGTVLLVLRKRLEKNSGFMDEVIPELEKEVLRQLELMQHVDELDDPNFSDTDYQLAAYSAALRVATQYTHIEGRDITEDLYIKKGKGHESILEALIRRALDIAVQYLIPKGIFKEIWRLFSNEEKLYLKGIEIESRGEARSGCFQEMARGFGIKDYKMFYAKTKANQTRFKSPLEFKKSLLNGKGFGNSATRHLLFAIAETQSHDDPRVGQKWLKAERSNFWGERKTFLALLQYLMRFGHFEHMPQWKEASKAAERLLNVLSNDPGV
ncbi:MAG: anti-phage-associated DUF1156 domain-containing protein [Waddliaceae bacterium]